MQSNADWATLAAMSEPDRPARPTGILAVRRGPGANCSSIGSAVEMLFLSATIGAAVLAVITAALRPMAREAVEAHDDDPPDPPPSPPHATRAEPDPTVPG